LLERVELEARAITGGHGVLAELLDRTEIRLDRLERRLDHLEHQIDTLDAKLDALGACSAGAWQALERIAQHLDLDEPPPAEERPRRGATKQQQRKASRAAGHPGRARRRAGAT
jgi:multidrug resistance efflux pump